jgi:hypothetical protein
MKSKMKTRVPDSMILGAFLVAALLVTALAGPLGAAAQAPAPSRFLGTITAINGNTLTVKVDANGDRQVEVPAEASVKRIAPGEKDLSKAVTIQFSDLAKGDRVLVKLDPDSPAGTSQALQIVAVKQEDVAQKQQKDREDWQLRGADGLVKSVDPASGVIVLTKAEGATVKTITVHTTKSTILKRYAPDSVRFDAAQPALFDAIHVGDQLHARGVKNGDGTDIAAEEVISGTFRSIAGTIASLDTASSTLVVKDLATKKQVTIHITPDAQMRRLQEGVARMLAARLNGASGTGGGGRGGAGQSANGGTGAGGSGTGGGGFSQRGGGQGGNDPMQFLNRAPVIQLAELKKGDAVMLVSTNGAIEVTAVALFAGVEPLLESPAATQSLLNNWSMGSGAAEAAAQ